MDGKEKEGRKRTRTTVTRRAEAKTTNKAAAGNDAVSKAAQRKKKA